MPFPYYHRLSRSDKAIYRESDHYGRIELPDAAALRPRAARLEEALAQDDRIAVERGSQNVAAAINEQLGVPGVSVRVLEVRPSDAESELHGLYIREEDETPVIHVWMRTAAKRHVVKFRTFLRTLLHELCHHLDYELLELDDSFHTEGFFQRESALLRDIAGESRNTKRREEPVVKEPLAKERVEAAVVLPKQLDLGF